MGSVASRLSAAGYDGSMKSARRPVLTRSKTLARVAGDGPKPPRRRRSPSARAKVAGRDPERRTTSLGPDQELVILALGRLRSLYPKLLLPKRLLLGPHPVFDPEVRQRARALLVSLFRRPR
jgi:hypothetical protein